MTSEDPAGQAVAAKAVSWKAAAPGVTLVTLNRPPANALAPELLDGLHAAIDAAEEADGAVRVMVIESAVAGFFAAGADIKHMSSIDAGSFAAYGNRMRAVNDRLAAAPWLSVAAVAGLALGGGLELALACTMRVSGPKARFGVPEVLIGLIPGAGGTRRLPRLIGRARALDMMITGRQVPAADALAIGLVDRLADGSATNGGPTEAALALAGELMRGSLPAQLAAVRAADLALDQPLAEGLADEAAAIGELFVTGEAREGIAAFVAKRRPEFGAHR